MPVFIILPKSATMILFPFLKLGPRTPRSTGISIDEVALSLSPPAQNRVAGPMTMTRMTAFTTKNAPVNIATFSNYEALDLR